MIGPFTHNCDLSSEADQEFEKYRVPPIDFCYKNALLANRVTCGNCWHGKTRLCVLTQVDLMIVLEESTTSSASEYSRLSKDLRILVKKIDLEKKPEGRVLIE
ncbi:hypothetical protein MTR_5g078920 [Medicago truncatula]|uniref:Uncharacterized protein n=1 Tax=Medicago truncatula TaxID=3880 RepID=G7K1V3_MEDTR|nr:hypothetical protein MTR_5g078920 [Medicago truncatula]